ncbi:hypothetical protein Q4494_15185 [Celeribacter halophilus]|uniref:O-antigen ligase like membrane protein n=1 Tax=Celeribacter halophilus TaxID=576117 RepID=A0AAW7XYV7_9RHOB|nr:hypothetical protein [Celeribacter halophilus]MDO6458433.1 hypothetical protein [Celeribacter halophilus]
MIRRSDLVLFLLQAYLFLTVLFYLGTGSPPLQGLLDELLLLAMLVVAVAFPLRSRSSSSSHAALVATTLTMTVIIGFLGAATNSDLIGFPAIRGAIKGLIIDAKFPLFMLASFFLLDASDTSFLRRLCKAIVLFGILHGALSLLDIVRGVDIHGRQLANRSGLIIANGIFDHKFKSAFANVLFFAAALHLQNKWTAAFAFFLCMIALSVKEMAAAALILTMSASTIRSALFRASTIAVIFLGITIFALTDNPLKSAMMDRVTTFVVTEATANTTVRTELYKSAPKVAVKYFPLGSGAGSFGSSPSRDTYYSPLYQEFHINHLHGGGTGEDGAFLIDTFWPKILGEYGFLGLITFCIPLLLAARTTNAPAFSKYMFWGLLVISVGTPVYNYSDGAIFGGIATGLILASRRKSTHRSDTALAERMYV